MINSTDSSSNHASKNITTNDENNSTCSVCHVEIDDNTKRMVITKCNHEFHELCISQWFNVTDTIICPYCRQVGIPLRRITNTTSKDIKQEIASKNRIDSDNAQIRDHIVQICKDGDIEELKIIHEKDNTIFAKPFFSLKNGQTYPLIFFAAQEGHVNIAEFLISKGADINFTPLKSKLSALHIACQYGRLRIIECLIKHGAKTEHKDALGAIPLANAVAHGNLDIVKFLIKKNLDIHVVSNNGTTILHFTAATGRTKIVEFLLEKGFIIDAMKDSGETPFQIACISGHQETAELLMEKQGGLDVNLLTSTLQISCCTNYKHIVKYLLTSGAMPNGFSNVDQSPSSPIHMAILNSNKEIVECLIENGACVDIINNDGVSALSLAALIGNKDIIKILLDNNVHVDVTDKMLANSIINAGDLDLFKSVFGNIDLTGVMFNDFITFIHIAVEKNDCQLIEYLITEKNIDIRSERPPIYIAIKNDKIKTVACLLIHGADINASSAHGSPLEAAIMKQSLTMVDYLLNNGANINGSLVLRNLEISPLELAINFSNCSIIKCLIDNKALVNDIVHGCSSLHIAVFSGNIDIVKCLCENGADIHIKNNKNKSPLDVAKDENNQAIVAYFEERASLWNRSLLITSNIWRLFGDFLWNKRH